MYIGSRKPDLPANAVPFHDGSGHIIRVTQHSFCRFQLAMKNRIADQGGTDAFATVTKFRQMLYLEAIYVCQ